MNASEITQHNANIRKEIYELEKKHALEMEALKSKIIAPCAQCPYDGVYRCVVCQEHYYIGFNHEELPWDIIDDFDHDDRDSDFDEK